MAVQSQVTPASILTERAANVISFYRQVFQMGEVVQIAFNVNITHSENQYLIDENNVKTKVIEQGRNQGSLNLTPEQVMTLFSTQVTLADGTVTSLGELIADRADELIEASLTTPPAGQP
jgi:hypothetical protein